MRKVGEDVTEILEYIPGRFEVIRHIRPRKNWLFAGSDTGGERAAIFYTLIRSAKMNLNPAVAFALGAETTARTTSLVFSPLTRKVKEHLRIFRSVIPANAGIHACKKCCHCIPLPWVPACAGTTLRRVGTQNSFPQRAATAEFRLNGLEPEAYLRDVLLRVGEHPVNAINDLLPWNIGKPVALRAAA